MYKITGKVGETIRIDEDIRITILDTNGAKARIAVYDPKRRIATKAGREESNQCDISERVQAPLISGSWLGVGKTDLLE